MKFFVVLIALTMFISFMIPRAFATSYLWNVSSGSAFFNNGPNWTPNGIPTTGDTAAFGLGTYYVFFETSPTIQNLNILAGSPTFGTIVMPPISFGPQTLTVTDTLSLPGANGNTLLTLGAPGLVPLTLNTRNLSMQNGAALTVQSGSQLSTYTFGSGLNGNLLIDGAQFNIPFGAVNSIGSSGGNGSLVLRDGATASTGSGQLAMGFNPGDMTSGSGTVSVEGGSTLLMGDYVDMADDDLLGSSATLDINDANSEMSFASNFHYIHVGSASHGTATINIGTTGSGATLLTSPDGITINATGTVTVGSPSTTGTLFANGDVNVNGGVFRVYSGSLFSVASGKTLTIQNNGTADFKSFNINGSSVNFVAGSLSYSGNLLVTFPQMGGVLSDVNGNLELGSDRQLSLTGTTTVDTSHVLSISGGTLHTASLVNNGATRFFSGTLTTGNATFSATGDLEFFLSGTTRNSKYGALVVTDSVTLAGPFDVIFMPQNGFTPAVGDKFDIFDWPASGPTDVFSQLNLQPLPAGETWDTSSLYTTGVLAVVATAIPGDYNGNGIVDAADYAVWRDHLGQSVTLPNDTTPGTVTQADYDVWKSNFGTHSGSGAGANAAVPEPATLWMFLTGMLTLCSQRCRKLINA